MYIYFMGLLNKLRQHLLLGGGHHQNVLGPPLFGGRQGLRTWYNKDRKYIDVDMGIKKKNIICIIWLIVVNDGSQCSQNIQSPV